MSDANETTISVQSAGLRHLQNYVWALGEVSACMARPTPCSLGMGVRVVTFTGNFTEYYRQVGVRLTGG